MIWRRSKDSKSPESIPTGDRLTQAVDTLAAVLRSYGKFAFDLDDESAEEIAAGCERQAEALLIGERKPQSEDGPPSGIIRDWRAVRTFFAEHRKRESEYVRASLGNLRQAVHSFAQCLTSSAAGDRRSDQQVGQRVQALSEALSANDAERIRREAGVVIETVSEAISQRRSREQKQLKLLAERLRYLRAELLEAREAATTDALTQLSNRGALDAHLTRVADLGLLFAQPPCLMMVDIDHFKRINDRYGHPAGDTVLKDLGKQLARTFLRKQDFVARYGGEEFAVVVVDTDLPSAQMLATRLCNAVRETPVQARGDEIEYTLSVGIAPLGFGESPSEWLARADRALYEAKSSGRDRIMMAAA